MVVVNRRNRSLSFFVPQILQRWPDTNQERQVRGISGTVLWDLVPWASEAVKNAWAQENTSFLVGYTCVCGFLGSLSIRNLHQKKKTHIKTRTV